MYFARPAAIVIGLGLALAGCVFHPDMGDRPQCESDADCTEFGDCACVGGNCVPGSPGATCGYEQVCDPPCEDPPASRCEVNQAGQEVLVTYADNGICEGGECQYEASKVICPEGCLGGACVVHCEMACDPGEDCIDGACRCGGIGRDCADWELCCGVDCVDPASDLHNCGGCGVDCDVPPEPECTNATTLTTYTAGPCGDLGCQFGETSTDCPGGCSGGSCADDPCQGRCGPNETCEDGVCICSGSGTACRGDEICVAAGCHCGQGPACDAFEACVEDTCVCAAAARACTAEEFCSPAGCACPLEAGPCLPPLVCCDGRCVDTDWDAGHCGLCGNACEVYQEAACQGDVYVTTIADGSCDLGYCHEESLADTCLFGCDATEGGCLLQDCDADLCDPEEFCLDGLCHCGFVGQICSDGEICCQGDCWESAWSNQHCGSCDNPCFEGLPNVLEAACDSGQCYLTCQDGFGDCDQDSSNGCEADLHHAVEHCGACGLDCNYTVDNADAICNFGFCGYDWCYAPFLDCDLDPNNGCEVNQDVDPLNCGNCGNECSDDLGCYGGQCKNTVDGSVLCGDAGETCASPEFCCVDADGTGYCADAANGDVCGWAALHCDGPEDCPAGGSCCLDPDASIASCSANGSCLGQVTLCHEAADCGFNAVCYDQDLFGILVGVCIGT